MAKTREGNGQAPLGILRSHADLAVAFFAAHFEPQWSFAKKLPSVLEGVGKHSKAKGWGLTADNKYVIRVPNKKFFYLFDSQVFYCQTLGLDPWIENLDDHFEALSIALSRMDVSRLKRVGFMVLSQLPLGMSHPEMCDLMFGSYLVDREELSPIYGNLDDVLLQLHGYYKGIRSQTTIAPQTESQASQAFLGIGNLESLIETKFLDTCIKDHHDRVARESLNLSIDLSKENVAVSALRSFLDDSLEGAERIAEGTVRRLKSLREERHEAHGD